MLAHINGIISEKGNGYLVLDCSGVGFLLSVSSATLAQAGSVGEKMKCHTYMAVREDAIELFGFATKEEKAMFIKLTGVTGVGAKSAMGILSALSVRNISLAIVTGDAAKLATAPGVGKKTAQRIILELKDKVDNAELVGTAAAAEPMGNLRTDAAGEAIEALMALGYQQSEAAKAVSAIHPQPEKSDDIIRMALKSMAKF